MQDNLKIKTIVSIGYMAISKIVTVAFSIAASIVLAQNLSSSDYGIVGFAMIFISFLLQMSDLGMESAVIRKANLDETGLYTGFTIKLILGPVLLILAFFISLVANKLFDNDAVIIVINVLSLNFLINSFAFLPNCLLKRELNYKKIFIPQVCSAIIGSTISIFLALTGFKYWSIVIASLCSSLTTALILNYLKPVRIKFRLDMRQASEFIRFGGSLFLSGFMAYAMFNMDNFMIGTLRGPRELGCYALAFTWGSMICSLLASTVHSVLFPAFSKIQEGGNGLKNIYLHALEYISFIAILTNIILLVVAQEFLVHILGHGTDKWLPALKVFRILCVYGIIRSLLEPVGNVFLALGKANILLRANVISAVLELILIYPAIVYFGMEGVAIVVTIAYASQYLIYFPYLKREFNLRYSDVWTVTKPTILSACVVVFIISLYSEIFQDKSIFLMIQKIFLGTLAFILFHGIITKWKILYEIRLIIKDFSLKREMG